jgi:hypothetical protein
VAVKVQSPKSARKTQEKKTKAVPSKRSGTPYVPWEDITEMAGCCDYWRLTHKKSYPRGIPFTKKVIERITQEHPERVMRLFTSLLRSNKLILDNRQERDLITIIFESAPYSQAPEQAQLAASDPATIRQLLLKISVSLGMTPQLQALLLYQLHTEEDQRTLRQMFFREFLRHIRYTPGVSEYVIRTLQQYYKKKLSETQKGEYS